MKGKKAPDKIYLYSYSTDGIYEVEIKPLEGTVEYIRTDAFIEKATLWLRTNASDYCILHNSYNTKELVDDFINAMKRE